MAEVETGLVTPAERELCYRLGYEIFCEEMGTMHDIADHTHRLVRDEAIERAHLLCARAHGEIVGSLGVLLGRDAPFPAYFVQGFEVARFLPVISQAQMAVTIRFLVRERFRGSRVPFQLLVATVRFLAQHGIQLVFCDCQPHLLPLYTGLGFRSYAPAFDQPGFGLMVPLLFLMIDHEHLRAIRSPLIRCMPPETAAPDVAAQIKALLPQEAPVLSAQTLAEDIWSEVYGLLSESHGRVGAFEGFTPTEINAFLEQGQILSCHRGQQVIAQGQGTRTVYVVLEGAVEVRKHGLPLAILSEGEMFGEFALLLQSKRTADVFAVSERVRLVALSERTLQRTITSRSELAAKFLFNLAKSLALKLAAEERP